MTDSQNRGGIGWLLTVAFTLAALTACSPKPVFQVNYMLPQSPAPYPQERVHVTATDEREQPQFLTPAAADDIKDYPRLFSLVVLRSEDVGDLAGAYEVMPLVRALFEKRLAASDVALLESPSASASEFEIVLKSFRLDYADRKWIAAMKYETVVRRPDGVIRRQMVSGSAERLKVWGDNQARSLVSELVSDMINKLDLGQLLAR